jgi:uncharacterized membrane protein
MHSEGCEVIADRQYRGGKVTGMDVLEPRKDLSRAWLATIVEPIVGVEAGTGSTHLHQPGPDLLRFGIDGGPKGPTDGLGAPRMLAVMGGRAMMYWDQEHGSAGGWVLMSLLMLAFVAALIVGIYLALRTLRGTGNAARTAHELPSSQALNVLDERLARGDIDLKDYQLRRDLLLSNRPTDHL